MSVESWIAEFYPVEAHHSIGLIDKELVEQDLRKWQGALKENCDRHEVVYDMHTVWEIGYNKMPLDMRVFWADKVYKKALVFNVESCALCMNYADHCSHCAFEKYLGRACIAFREELGDSTYHAAGKDPQVMIDWLEELYRLAKAVEG